VRLGYDEAIKSIEALLANGHHAEALVTTMFTVEKTFYRVLRQLVISAGFPPKQADLLLGDQRGFEKVKGLFPCFDPALQPLSGFLEPRHLAVISETQTMRNRLVHGKQVYGPSTCKAKAEELLGVLGEVRRVLLDRYDFDGWSKYRWRRTSTLHSDPKVKIPAAPAPKKVKK
jgi:hypothetical protein